MDAFVIGFIPAARRGAVNTHTVFPFHGCSPCRGGRAQYLPNTCKTGKLRAAQKKGRQRTVQVRQGFRSSATGFRLCSGPNSWPSPCQYEARGTVLNECDINAFYVPMTWPSPSCAMAVGMS